METGLDVPMMGSLAPREQTLYSRIDLLRGQAAKLSSLQPQPRQERLSGLHNPWGFGAGLVDSWLLLDLCEDSEVLDTVENIIGPDIVLWDTELYLKASTYQRFVRDGREGRYWPVMPLQGAVVIVPMGAVGQALVCLDLDSLTQESLPVLDTSAPLYVLRYMPATSAFQRDAMASANWKAMQEQPLLNFTQRPLWLVRGEDRAGNDFVTGFTPQVPRWAINSLKEG
jgi:hypothetical protein